MALRHGGELHFYKPIIDASYHRTIGFAYGTNESRLFLKAPTERRTMSREEKKHVNIQQ